MLYKSLQHSVFMPAKSAREVLESQKFGSLAPLAANHIGFCRAGEYLTLKMIAEYLEHALQFERMAAAETKPEIRVQFEKQALAYRKLAIERSNKLGSNPPSGSDSG